MGLHRLSSVVIGVPNVAETAAFYTDFGLTPTGGRTFATTDGGDQLRLVETPRRRLVEIHIGADDRDDLGRITQRLTEEGLGLEHSGEHTGDRLTAIEPVTGTRAVVEVRPRLVQDAVPATPYNGPGRIERVGRAPGVGRVGRVRPRKLGHVVLGTTDLPTTERFFRHALGFRLSDRIGQVGAFLRCSTDHHNLLVLEAPVAFLHHTSWQVDDIDEVGRGASAMLADHPERHIWGLGRHHAGSNFFWYLKDPAGNFSEYYSDLDTIGDEQAWTPENFEGAKGLFNWGPPPPPSFLAPDDLGTLMAGVHGR
ncbi:MAG: dioxygenase [Pseudonocardia sp. SCN 72-86]|nr:MAG: dioxygenase [Pseudonocardia sp. SCN 72-86]